jgi:type I restriction enzyme, S subunit
VELTSATQLAVLGEIPMDWSLSTVVAEFSMQLGKMLDSERNSGIPKPYLGNRAVQWGKIDIADLGMVKLSPDDLNRFRLCDGDLLVCEGGEVGRSAIWRGQLDECYYQKALHRLRARRGYSAELMLSVLRLYSDSGLFSEFVTQTSIAHLPKDKFGTVPIPRPPEAEQRVIASALTDADGLIESLERLIVKKRRIKQGAMQDLLTGKRRLPGFEGEWVTRRLRDLGKWRGGSTPLMSNSKFWTPGTTPWVTSSDVRPGAINKSPRQISDAAVQETNATVVPPSTVLVVIRSGILRNFLPVAITDAMIAINQDIRALVDGPLHDPGFLLQFLIGHQNLVLQRCLKSGTTVESIDSTWFREFEIVVPDLQEQAAIATVLSDMDSEIAALETKLTKARRIKQGMMQQLLTGRIRLPVSTPAKEEVTA